MYNMHYWGGGAWDGANIGLGFPLWFPSLFIGLAVWSLFWKGLALWHSSRRGQPWWFVVLLVINTAGILDIVYLFFFAKLKFDDLFRKHEPRS